MLTIILIHKNITFYLRNVEIVCVCVRVCARERERERVGQELLGFRPGGDRSNPNPAFLCSSFTGD